MADGCFRCPRSPRFGFQGRKGNKIKGLYITGDMNSMKLWAGKYVL